MENIKLFQGDCLELMKRIPDGSVDAIITDPPYGTTACKQLNRKFIGFELDKEYFKIAKKRIEEA